ncbi:MAG: hypothetical protein QXS83_01820 [Thermoplasmata archaeon]
MDGMQKFKDEINRIRALAETPEITIIATGSLASRVLDVFAAQTKLRNVRTVIIDTSENIKTLSNIQTKVLLPDSLDDANTLAANLAFPRSDIIVILTALGGHTSSILAPIIAETGRRMGCLVIAVPILPFTVERERRTRAEQVLSSLRQIADIVTVIDNDQIPKKLRLSDTPNYTARRLQTLLDTLLPSLPFAVVERLLKEIEEETKKISIQMQKPAPQQLILSATSTENREQNPIEIEEIIVEKLSGGTETQENTILTTEKEKEGVESFTVETAISERLREICNERTESPKEERPEQPKVPQKEKELTPKTELESR